MSKERRQRNYQYKRYGLTVRSYNKLLYQQGCMCAICGREIDPQTERLHVDHDHQTGKVRGLLCVGCNTGLGKFCDDPELLSHAATYLRYNGT